MKPIISVSNLDVFYGAKQALHKVHIDVQAGGVLALIGPSGCGKSTFLRCLNRMNDRIPGFRATGDVDVAGVNPYSGKCDLLELRRKMGMVFQKPNPFPKTIFENIALGLKCHYGLRGKELEDRCSDALKKAALWGEVKDDWMKKSGMSLSGGQQQRLCIARALAVDPEILLMDEPCSALDPISSEKIEDLIKEISGTKTVVIVTHNLQQAERVSTHTAFFMLGEIVEASSSHQLFKEPQKEATRDYVSGRFG